MVRYEQVKGLKVVTINEGKEIGKVDDLFVDPDMRQVTNRPFALGRLMCGTH